MMKFVRRAMLAVVASLFLLAPVYAGNDAAYWIRDMSRAMEELTYEGTFVYLHGDEIETMQIIHDHDEMGVRERLSSQNGEARVIIRDSEHVTCIWPGSKSVIVSKSQPRTPFPQFDTDVNPDFAQFYKFMVSGEDRVAGKETMVVAMMPIDQYRYGYKLWVDKESKLLLRSMLLDSNEQVIEQVMFTDIRFPKKAEEGLFNTESLGSGYQWQEAVVKNEGSTAGQGYINFRALPKGFSKISERMRPMPMNTNPVRHAIVSDGVAAVSVYVEYSGDDPVGEMKGASSMGAMHAYGIMLKQGFVTAVGEVPPETAKLVAEAVVLP